MEILLYGNCQAQVLNTYLTNIPSVSSSVITCHTCSLDKVSMIRRIKSADVIITQPIKDNYREVDYLSTKFVIDTARNDTEVILFPSLMAGNIYYTDMVSLDIPFTTTQFFHRNLIDYYKNAASVQDYIKDVIHNENLISKEDLELNASRTINAMTQREVSAIKKYKKPIIRMAMFIKHNWKKNLLFYMPNHPTKHLYQHLMNIICDKLDINSKYINLDIDPQSAGNHMILYSCLNKVVEFDVNSLHGPYLRFKKGFNARNKASGINDYCNDMYKLLKNNFNPFKSNWGSAVV